MLKSYFFLLFLAFPVFHSCDPTEERKTKSEDQQPKTEAKQKEAPAPENEPEMVAVLETQKGTISFELYFKKTPLTVANFVALAEGDMPNPHRPLGDPYYDGLQFHRVEKNFVIQAGCPLNTGTGNPGYQFQDEFSPTLRHDEAGVVSMANSGPNTNGSQFFITLRPLPHLNAKHAVFGKVIEGMDIVKDIQENDVITGVEIIRNSDSAKNFNAKEIFYQRSFETYETH